MKIPEYKRNFELEQNYWWFTGVRRMVWTLLKTSGLNGRIGKALDVGCGTGALLDELRDRADEVWGIDIANEALDFCRQRGHTNLIQADATQLPFEKDEFDVVTAIGVIEHLEDDESFIHELTRVLKPEGILVVLTSSFPFIWSMHDVANEHQRRYYLRPLRKRFENAGLETVRFSHLNFFLFPALAPMLIGHRCLFGLKSDKPERILPVPPAPVNKLLDGILHIEAGLMKLAPLPFGVSMIGAFRKVNPKPGEEPS